MTTENGNVTVDTGDTTATTETKKAPEGESAEARLARIEVELATTTELLSKVRRFEKENKTAAQKATEARDALEKQLHDEVEKRTALEGKVRGRIVDAALEKALADAKAKAPATAMKLLDKAKVAVEGEEVDVKSVEALIKELQASDPILFETETATAGDNTTKTSHPPVRKATEGEVVGGFEKDLSAATSMKEIEAVMRKYGKMA